MSTASGSAPSGDPPDASLQRSAVLGGWAWTKVPASPARTWAYRVVAIIVVLAAAGVYLGATVHVPDIYGLILRQTFTTAPNLEELVVLATPFFLTALAALIPLRVGLWNVGGEGQFFAGAWLATGFVFWLPHLPGPLMILGMFLAGAIGGALWATIPMLAKVYLNVNEIISTLMLNLVIVYWVAYWLTGPWQYGGSTGGTLQSRFIPAQAHLPLIHTEGGLDSGLLIAIAITVVAGIVFRYSIFGYRSFIVGAGRPVALFSGVRVRRVLVISFLVAGAIAGVAGVLQLAGNAYQLTPGLSNNTGYLGIAVAILAGNSVVGLGIMACMLAAIMLIGQTVQIYGVSSQAVFVVIGLLLLFNAIGETLSQYKLSRTSPRGSLLGTGDVTGIVSHEELSPGAGSGAIIEERIENVGTDRGLG
ncbi:MAG: ABC transporter permease [Acidimicrobiales bacterium]